VPIPEFLRRSATCAAWTAGILFVPAVLSALFATWSAVSDGHITLYSLGKTATSREIVPWTQGWSRLVSPAMLLAAGLTYPAEKPPPAWRLLLFTALAVAGSSMLVFSLWFKTFGGALALAALLLYVASAQFVDAFFGRPAVCAMLGATVIALLYAYAAA
jgi:hypothetical protein